MSHSSRALRVGASVVAAGALVLTAGCSAQPSAGTTDLAIGSTDLSGACPATVVAQTNWNPEGEHGPLYELVGPDPVVDAGAKTVTGPLMSRGEYTGVSIEVRAGGPAIGYQTVSSQMYADPDIMLGYVEMSEAVQNSAQLPTTSVFAQFDADPAAMMWDPATYPDAEGIADLAAAGAPLLAFDGSTSVAWLVDSGAYPADLVDRSYDGTPANFVAQGGRSTQMGFATAEPYIYENEVEGWAKPMRSQLLSDVGWPNYAPTVAVRSADLAGYADCLRELVPVLQQAEIDYVTSPDETNTLIADLVDQYANGWVYSKAVADYAASRMQELGLARNGDNGYVGDFDEARVAKVMALMDPILASTGAAAAPDLTPADLYTNEFLDQSVGFAGQS